MSHTDLMSYYTLASELTTGSDKYYSLTEYEDMIPFERDIYLDLIVKRQHKQAGYVPNTEDTVTDFESVE